MVVAMDKGNLVGIFLSIAIFLGLMGFLASKIQIYDGTIIEGIPTTQSVLDSIFDREELEWGDEDFWQKFFWPR